MELSRVAPVRLSHPRDRTWLFVAAIALLIALRFVAAAVLPLYYGDEPYYWLWSRNLAWGYYEHPPAIAFLIRAGTALFGDTAFGVRFFGLVLSVPATLCVWRTASLLLGGKEDGARAALFFNLTLMITVQTFMATPNAPELACSSAFVWAMAEVAATGGARWWLAAGLFAGLGLLSKYTMLLVGAGAFLWLLIAKEGRAWLRTPWPWLGGGLAALVFLPNVIWVANHEWGTFAFQFGRVFDIDGRWWYFPQFLGEQLIFASPFLFFLAMRGICRATVSKDQRLLLIATLFWPMVLFLVVHAMHDRVHRSWVSVVYPVLAVAAADGFRRGNGNEFVRSTAVPVAALFLAVVFAEAFFRIIPRGPIDPLYRRHAVGMTELTGPIFRELSRTGAHGILTRDFRTTAWLKFYLSEDIPVIDLTGEHRFASAPRALASDLGATLLYVTLNDNTHSYNDVEVLRAWFSEIDPLESAQANGADGSVAPFLLYRLAGFHGEPLGRIP